MSDPSTASWLEAGKHLLERITPGPWAKGPTVGIGQVGLLRVVDQNGERIADCEAERLSEDPTRFTRHLPEDTANAEFIIWCRTHVPTLIAELEKAERFCCASGQRVPSTSVCCLETLEAQLQSQAAVIQRLTQENEQLQSSSQRNHPHVCTDVSSGPLSSQPSVPNGGDSGHLDGVWYDEQAKAWVAKRTVYSAGRTEDEAHRALASAIHLTAKYWPLASSGDPGPEPKKE